MTSPKIDRLPEIPREQMTEAQRAAVDELVSGPRGKLSGPFVPLMRSPELMRRLQKVGEYLRYDNTVGLHNSEFAVLVVARHWSQPVEWHIHKPIAMKAGVSEATCDAIAEGRRPPNMTAEETVVYDLGGCTKDVWRPGRDRHDGALWLLQLARHGHEHHAPRTAGQRRAGHCTVSPLKA